MKRNALFLLSSILLLSGCSSAPPPVGNPPYNDFEPQKSKVPESAAVGAAAGGVIGALVSPAGAGAGVLIGGTTHAISAAQQEDPQKIIDQLPNEHIQVVKDGDTITLLVPTDIYYLPDSYEFDDVWYRGLDYISQLVLKTKTNQVVYVAGFSDGGIGSPLAKQKLSQQRAQQMADFLWANGVPLTQLRVQGFGKRYDIADNFLIHGAAMNRRIEIQWRVC